MERTCVGRLPRTISPPHLIHFFAELRAGSHSEASDKRLSKGSKKTKLQSGDLVQGTLRRFVEGLSPGVKLSPYTPQIRSDDRSTLVHPRRQREYPQPPPPSTNSTRTTINTVSML
jgi:hypothetical protein